MGKSIYTQLVEGSIDVDHNGDTLSNVSLPVWMQELGHVYAQGLPKEDEETALTDVLIEYEMVSEFYALACQQALVGCRATTRPADKPHPSLKGETVKVSILTDEQKARVRAEAYKPKPLQRPKQALTPEQEQANAIATLKASGLTLEQIEAMLQK